MDNSESLHQTPVVPLLPTIRVGGSFRAWLRQRDFLLRALVTALCLTLFLNLTQCVLLIKVVKKRVVVVVLDPNKKTWLGDGQPLDEATELHQSMAQDATDTLLSRNPAEFRYLARLPRLFSRDMQPVAQQLRLNEEADFTQRQLRQTPEIARIEVRTSTWSGVEVVVTGRLERWGELAGQPVHEFVPFTLKLTLTPNRDLLQATRYPLIVTDFNLTYL